MSNTSASYARIQKKIAELQLKADKLRAKEIDGVISRIKVAIEHYGITAAQLFDVSSKGAKTVSATKAVPKSGRVLYSDGNGNTWSGRGPRPRWLRDAISEGRSLDEFLSASVRSVSLEPSEEPKSQGASKPKRAPKIKRRPSTVLYRDGAGNSWTGRGPQPRWMKEALAAGKTLEELRG